MYPPPHMAHGTQARALSMQSCWRHIHTHRRPHTNTHTHTHETNACNCPHWWREEGGRERETRSRHWRLLLGWRQECTISHPVCVCVHIYTHTGYAHTQAQAHRHRHRHRHTDTHRNSNEGDGSQTANAGAEDQTSFAVVAVVRNGA
jgi:hypothetical protein